MANLLDRAIGWWNPRRGLARERARQAMQMLRGYEGAKTGRRTDSWIATGTSANAEIGRDLARLRNRARDAVRNNPYASRISSSYVANTVGTGIIPTWADPAIEKLWQVWQNECDADGQLDFYGLQALAVRTIIESGAVLVRFRPRRTEDGLSVPFQIQVLEPDHIDLEKSNDFRSAAGAGYISQGIEYDGIGRRTAYWLFPEHPGDYWLRATSFSSKAVPASEVLHLYEKHRPGQQHGVPWLAPVLITMHDLDGFEDAHLFRKRIEACIVGVVTQPEGADGPTLGKTIVDAAGNPVESFEPGMFAYGPPGYEVSFNNPSTSGGYAEYTRERKHAIGAGTDIPYSQLTGDLSQATYSSWRGGRNEFNRRVEQLQWLTMIPGFCNRIGRRFVDMALASRMIRTANYEVVWTPPRFESIDPLKDAQAATLLARSGIMPHDDIVASYGYNPAQHYAKLAELNALFDQLGIVLDTDPRKVAKSGTVQAEDAAEDTSEDDTEMEGKPNGRAHA